MNQSIKSIFEKFKHNLKPMTIQNQFTGEITNGYAIEEKEINQLKSEIQEIVKNNNKAVFDDIEKIKIIYQANERFYIEPKKWEELKKKWGVDK